MEGKELVKVGNAPPTVLDPELTTHPSRIVVVAKNPDELNASQARLVEWAKAKLAEEKTELAELQENYRVAQKSKWRSDHLKRLVAKKQKELEFYEKIEAALKAGYYVLPNFPVELFAIRTTQKRVSHRYAQTDHPWGGNPEVEPQTTNAPPLEEGRYVSNRAANKHGSHKDINSEDKEVTVRTTQAIGWGTIDFPFLTVAKPEVIKATQRAIKKLIFDELGVVPHQRKQDDPMVIGKVVLREGWKTLREVSFLVAWFLDTDTI